MKASDEIRNLHGCTLPPNALETDFLRYTRAKQKTALKKLWK